MKQLTQAYKKLKAQHEKYAAATKILEKELSEKIDFEFSVEYMSGDGFMILQIGTSYVSSVGACIEHIKEHGNLTGEDHKQYAI